MIGFGNFVTIPINAGNILLPQQPFLAMRWIWELPNALDIGTYANDNNALSTLRDAIICGIEQAIFHAIFDAGVCVIWYLE